MQILTMLFYTIIGCLCVTQAGAISRLTDAETENVTLQDEAIVTKTDVLKMLLNQETLIRMSLVKDVNSIMEDMLEVKEMMSTNNIRLGDVEKEISSLKNELQLLKTENQKLKEQGWKFQDDFKANSHKFNEIDRNLSYDRVQCEKNFNDTFKEYEKNTSKILNFIKAEVSDLSVKLLDLNKYTVEQNKSIPNLIESELTEHSANVNKLLSDINQNFTSSKDSQKQLLHNLSALENDVTSIKTMISEMKTSVGFTAGMTSSSSTWSGDILVFPHIVTNYGNGYNPRTGKFTAPTDGTYVFFVHVNAFGSNFIYLDIVINGSSKVRTLAHNSAKFRTGTNMAVLQLVIGDSVWVGRYDGQSYYTHSAPITTFSGFLC